MEEWRDIPGYEGLYQICIDTPEGRCRAMNYNHTGTMNELNRNPRKNDGRIYWCLLKDGKGAVRQAARWIALTYPELVQNEYFEGAQIDHIDGDKLNNHPSNLRWVTPKENMNNPVTKKQISNRQLNINKRNKCIWQYSLNNKFLRHYLSIEAAERETGVSRFLITQCCTGERISAGGYIYKYAD